MRMIFSFLLALGISSGASAQTAQIDRIDIVGKGIYQVEIGKPTTEKQTPTGVATAVDKVKNIEATTTVPARRGLEFGFRYKIVGRPDGAQVPLRIVNIYPKPGLRNPTTRKTIQRSEFVRTKAIGDIHYTGYAFENDWEAVPGVWKFQIWHKRRMLAEQIFTVAKP